MYDGETRMLLKHYLDEGMSKAGLASWFGASRRTVRCWIAVDQLDRDPDGESTGYARRAPTAHNLSPFKGIIGARLQELSRLTGQWLYVEVRATGSLGGHVRVPDYVRQIRPLESAEPVVRFETPRGR